MQVNEISYRLKYIHVKNILLNYLKNNYKNKSIFHPSIFINENKRLLDEKYNITLLIIEHDYYTNYKFILLYSNLEFSYILSTYDFIEPLPF